MGDYANNELYKLYDKPKLYKGVVENYNKLAPNTKAILFCVNCEHSRNTADEFVNNGILAMHLDADVPSEKRKEILEDFANGKFNVLLSGIFLPIPKMVSGKITQKN